MQMRLWRFLAPTGEPLQGKGWPEIKEKFEFFGGKLESLAKSLNFVVKTLKD